MLQAYLRHLARTPFALGRTDCALVLADWLMWNAPRAPDPAANLRGTYATEAECVALLERMGGLVAVVADLAARAGLKPSESPATGDIAVVFSAGAERGAIRTHLGRWAIKPHDGLAVTSSAKVLACWSVACPLQSLG